MYAIEIQGTTKIFHGSHANKEVFPKVEQGEIHSLPGENGVGRTTLMKILFGLHKANKGRIPINGNPAAIHSLYDAIDCGISMVHQHFVLVGNFTIMENIILGHEPRKGILLDRSKARQKVDMLIRRYHSDLNSGSRIENLSVGEKQRVEILKALYNKSSIILLDEPTAVLTLQEVQELLAVFRQLKKDGRIIIIIIHKSKEILAIAGNITIPRRGENIVSLPATQVAEDKLAESMVGQPISFDVQRAPYDGPGPVKLGFKNTCLKKKGRPVLTDISPECRADEILGIVGVEGNGQTELIEVVTGTENHFTGQVCCGSQSVSAISPCRMLDHVGHISEERGKRGFVKGFSNQENLILGYHYWPEYVKYGSLSTRRIRQVVGDTIKQFDVRTDGIDQLISSLSGGNQQKLTIGRTLFHQSNIIVAAQPTRGMSIGAIEYTHQHLMQMRDSGSAILLISVDLGEVIKLADRIAVLYEGRVVAEKETGAFTKTELGYYMLGGDARKEAAGND